MGNGEFIQIVDAALAEAARKSGAWLVCRPGCCECCRGPFAISDRDAVRLRAGLAELEKSDPARADRVRDRARATAALPAMGDDDPCPVLDPETGTCDLYSARPFTCRVFGPPIQWGGDAVGVCELCFEGATQEEIAACAVDLAVPDEELNGETLIALALAQ
ncbi:MAG TPA: YkgJ family cysteine cluster protein [Bryobacteraceae bacterium]|jgi:Fe-S-cluster containining protein|nr:YkgJ family cysteine cluster protein [Bryobacteraceae bacterium]